MKGIHGQAIEPASSADERSDDALQVARGLLIALPICAAFWIVFAYGLYAWR